MQEKRGDDRREILAYHWNEVVPELAINNMVLRADETEIPYLYCVSLIELSYVDSVSGGLYA